MIRAVLITLGLAAAGGAAAAALNLPLAWLIGAMLATMVAGFAGVPLALPAALRLPMIALLGVYLGAAFTPELGAAAAGWLGLAAAMAAAVCLMTVLAYCVFRIAGRYDRTTAFFAATPGGISEMVLVGEAMGADIRILGLVHATRVVLTVTIVPFAFVAFGGASIAPLPPDGFALADATVVDLLRVAGLAAAGAALGRLLRLPAWGFSGALALTAVWHLTGGIPSVPPVEAVAVAQVVIGAAIGARFSGAKPGSAARPIALGTVTTLGMLGIAAGTAAILAQVSDQSFKTLTLALAPGGLAEMALIAASAGLPTAFVSAMHVLRIALVITAAPLVYRSGVWFTRP